MSSVSDDAGSKSANSLDFSDDSEGEIYQVNFFCISTFGNFLKKAEL